MTSPFPLAGWPADGSTVTKALMDQKINDVLTYLNTLLLRAGYGSALVGSTSSQSVSPSTWTALGFSTPTSSVAGTGLSISPSGILVDNDGLYIASVLMEVPANTTGARRIVSVASTATASPAAELPCQSSGAPNAATSYLNACGLVALVGGTRYTAYNWHDATVSLTISRRWFGLTRLA